MTMRLAMLLQSSVDSRDVHPFVKWTGGKSQLLPELDKMIPSQFNTYFQPFLGGGAKFFNMVSIGMKFNNAYLSDTHIELITAYEVIKVKPKEVIELLQTYDVIEEILFTDLVILPVSHSAKIDFEIFC